MHKVANQRFGKTDVRYWEKRIYLPRTQVSEATYLTKNYAVQIQFKKRRRTFTLGTANKAVAAARAKDIFLTLRAQGWEAFDEAELESHPSVEESPDGNFSSLTLGEYIQEASALADVSSRTLEDYARALRRIVGDIAKISKSSKRFDYRRGGRDAWLKKVDAIELSSLTSAAIQKWKLQYAKTNGGDPERDKAARNSANAYLRLARSLFSEKKVLRHLNPDVKNRMPSPLPFQGVEFFPRSSTRYVSRIDAEEIIVAARDELGATLLEKRGSEGELGTTSEERQFLILVLALCAGLRRNEIDKLLWSQVDLARGQVGIYPTKYLKPKSEDSTGVVDLDPEVIVYLEAAQNRSDSPFVIESLREPVVNASYSCCRAADDFVSLYRWLRAKGVDDRKPLHALRKEFGSVICQKHGLYIASRALRHADLGVTASFYIDKKVPVCSGIGSALKSNE